MLSSGYGNLSQSTFIKMTLCCNLKPSAWTVYVWPARDTNPFQVNECMWQKTRSAQPAKQLCIKNMYTIRLQHLESEATLGQNSTLRELSNCSWLEKSHRDPFRGAMQTVTEHAHTRNSNSLTQHGASCVSPLFNSRH